MQNNESTIEVLSDLIKINNDRIAGYRRAVNESGNLDIDLKATFSTFMSDSETYKQQLAEKLLHYGGEPIDDATTVSGKVYRMWMDIKATFTGSDRKTILASCEFGEDAAQKAYEGAIAFGSEIAPDVMQLIVDQKTALKKAHDIIKNYRDLHETLS